MYSNIRRKTKKGVGLNAEESEVFKGLVKKSRPIPKDEVVFRGIHLMEDELKA